jgi:hypothetical protein
MTDKTSKRKGIYSPQRAGKHHLSHLYYLSSLCNLTIPVAFEGFCLISGGEKEAN